MASHVVVIDTTARRAQIKTTPNKPLSEVLEEACNKLGLKASNYGLKNNNKQVDLSRSLRLSGLSSGAKLELVQLSKSAGVVSLALQLPESEVGAAPNGRLTDKFPSTTTLWQVLRKFEAGVGGGGSKINITARGAPSAVQGDGRLYYEQPVLQVATRELASLTDLQKNLSQLGLNSGSALIRLNFRKTETPFEEAILQIQRFFDSMDGPSTTQSHQQTTPPSDPSPALEATESSTTDSTVPPTTTDPSQPSQPSSDTPMSDPPSQLDGPPEPPESISPTTSRPLSVYRPPTSSTPSAALTQHNESDYTPTVEHAQVHQRLLNQSSRNTRLPTEAELAAQAEAEAEKLAAIKEVEIKIRFPDQSSVTAKFTQNDTGAILHNFVRDDCLDTPWKKEPFTLRNPGVKVGVKGDIIPDSEKKLITQLGLKGRVLVIFGWAEQAISQAKLARSVLREELRRSALEIKIRDVPGATAGEEESGVRVNVGRGVGGEEDREGSGSGGGVAGKIPKWMKLGKK